MYVARARKFCRVFGDIVSWGKKKPLVACFCCVLNTGGGDDDIAM